MVEETVDTFLQLVKEYNLEDLLRQLKEQYQRNGQLAPTGKLEFSPEGYKQKLGLSVLLDENVGKDNEPVSFSLNKIIKRYSTNKKQGSLANISLADFRNILFEYYGELETNREKQKRKQQTRNQRITQLKEAAAKKTKEGWFQEILKSCSTQIINQLLDYHDKAPEEFLATVKYIDYIISNREKLKGIKLGVLANKLTNDPHFFDQDHQSDYKVPHDRLLKYALQIILDTDSSNLNQLLRKVGIYPNAVSSLAYHYGLRGYIEGEAHSGWQADNEEGTYRISTFEQVKRLDRIEPKTDIIYMFENPNVFSKVLAAVQNEQVSLICGNGRTSWATKILLQSIIENNPEVEIYYSGDFDRAGLEIADYLYSRYPENFNLWMYTIDVYQEFAEETSELPVSEQDKNFKRDKLNELYLQMDYKLFEENLLDYIAAGIKRK